MPAEAMAPPTRPAPEDQGQTASERVVQAHQAVRSAAIEVRYAAYFTYPDETKFFTTDYRVQFDRDSSRLRVDRPGYTLVCDGTDILLVAEDLPGRHLRVALDGPLTYKRLVEVFPDLAEPMPPALIFLLADPPMAWLSAGFAEEAKPFDPKVDDDQRPHLRLPVQFGSAEMAFDADSLLINEMHARVDEKQLAGSGIDAIRFRYDIAWTGVDKPVDDGQFKLDLKGSHEATTLAQFLAAPPHPGRVAGAGAGGGEGGGGSLIGQPLPDVELEVLDADKKIKLSELNQGVVVLEFFASWTRPSVLDIPALLDFKDWCKDNEHDVAVYTVAVGEKSKAMRKWIEALEDTADKKLDLPVLLDSRTEAALAMKLPTVPRTLVFVDGKVVEVYGGMKPNFLEDLKKGTPGWLEKAGAQPDG